LLETNGTPEHIVALGHYSMSYDPEFKILLKAAEYAVRECLGNLTMARSFYSQALMDYIKTELKISEYHIKDYISQLLSYFHGPNTPYEHISFDQVILRSTKLHCFAVEQLLSQERLMPNQIDVIGYHGQTLFHRPSKKISVVLGDGQYLADQLGIAVVTDFRQRDILAGGQGAPFAPLYHLALAIRDQKLPCVIVNCGGIGNVTLIRSANELELIAFDTGPGNALVDRLIQQRTHGKESMDRDGPYGMRGEISNDVLQALYEKSIIKDKSNYFLLKPPKSLDYGDIKLISELDLLSLESACATLEAFTADSIIRSFEFCELDPPSRWILAGGGWNNPVIRREFEMRLVQKFGNGVQICSAEEAGWNSTSMEAEIFAYLAVRSLLNKPLSMPGTTWVPEPLSGGRAYLPNAGSTKKVAELIQANEAVLSGYQ
jgi:anhydro-N-acetylmuramic acid kinase